jgi:class 3 adenylate cyclase
MSYCLFMANLPTGTVTFLFTDIEGSTRLWQEHPHVMQTALARHHTILQQTIRSNNGHIFQIIGDAFCAAFTHATDALAADAMSTRPPHLIYPSSRP